MRLLSSIDCNNEKNAPSPKRDAARVGFGKLTVICNFRLTLADLLDCIEDEPNVPNSNIYILPPVGEGDNTDVDSDDSDEEHSANVNNLPRSILCQPCEVVPTEDEDDNYDFDDLIPLSELRKKLILEKNTSKEVDVTFSYKRTKWTPDPQEMPNNNINTNCDPVPASDQAKNSITPSDFFHLFFDDEVMNLIIQESNRYARQQNTELNLTIAELHVFLGILLLSGYGKYPNRRIYWSSEEDVPKIVQNSMRLKRFEMILRFIHFNDNSKLPSDDRLYKLRPFLEILGKNFRAHGGLDEHLSVDESMVPYYGKHYAKQFIQSKPIRFGYKNWALCSSNGYMYGFDVYTGKDNNKPKNLGLGGDVVMFLLEQVGVPENQGFKLYFDNFFTGLPLLSHLANKKYCAVGTIRENRLEQCPLLEKKQWSKKERGAYKYYKNEQTLLVQWKDNKVVSLASNFETNDTVTTSRWDRVSKTKKALPQPKMVATYNKGMGGVDKLDNLVAAYRTRIRQRKWYWPLVAYFLDVSVVNGWLLMRKLQPEDKTANSLLVFRRYIALTFLKSFGVKPQQGRISRPLTDVRRDNFGHLIVYNETDRRCAFCGKKSNFICQKCNVALHPKICFYSYHTS